MNDARHNPKLRRRSGTHWYCSHRPPARGPRGTTASGPGSSRATAGSGGSYLRRRLERDEPEWLALVPTQVIERDQRTVLAVAASGVIVRERFTGNRFAGPHDRRPVRRQIEIAVHRVRRLDVDADGAWSAGDDDDPIGLARRQQTGLRVACGRLELPEQLRAREQRAAECAGSGSLHPAAGGLVKIQRPAATGGRVLPG